MGKVFYNKPAIPIPEGCYKDISGGRVLGKIHEKDGTIRRRTIGSLATETTMYPNEFFQQRFPDLWKMYYHEKDYKEYELSIGLYGLTLGISHTTTLYPILHDCYGESNVNYILDYAMYSLLDRTNTTQLFPERMRKEVLFSEKVYSDSWYSGFFKNQMPENINAQFRLDWLSHCRDLGITEAWLCIDGSNNDCEVEKSSLCEQGHPKSKSNSDIIGYMYAINATDGRPITYYVYEESKPDSQAFHQICLFLAKANIKVKGVILDSGFCYDSVLQTICDCSFEYVVMMHNNFLGHTSMHSKYGELIRWDMHYSVSDDGVFGISDYEQLFSIHPRKTWVNHYFDSLRGTLQSEELVKRIRAEKRRLDKLIEKGRSPAVKPEFEKYIELAPVNGQKKPCFKYEKCNEALHSNGYFSIASSSDFGPEAVLDIYRLRDASETSYSIMKSQEGLDTTRVHSTPSILAKFALGFIESILRSELTIACKHLGLATNDVIHKLESVHLFLAGGNEYVFSKSIREDLRGVLGYFGITEQHIDALASEVNYRLDTNYTNRFRALPDISKITHAPGSEAQTTSNPDLIEQEQDTVEEEFETNPAPVIVEKKPRGRKKGSKDSYPRKRRTKAEIEAAKNQ